MLLLAAVACSRSDDNDKLGNWHKDGTVGSLQSGRIQAAGFVVGDTAYYGTGMDGNNGTVQFWSYDSKYHTWQQIADFPGVPRWGAAAFGAGGKGYVGTGFDGYHYYKDFYQYDPSQGQWTRIDDLPALANARRYATGFGIDNTGYLTSGQDSTPAALKDFYSLNTSTNQWTKERGEYSGDPRFGASVFVLNKIAYFVSGQGNSINQTDFYAMNPDSLAAGVNGWHKLRDITNSSTDSYDDKYTTIVRVWGAAFTLGNKGYLTTGQNTGNTSTCWEYDPVHDTWTQKTDFEGNARYGAIGFSLGNRGFIAGGGSSTSNLFTDMYYFSPNETMVAND
ncbi:MAG TPA: kelch repeat-containing protein [Chitinophaga sp.]